MLTRFKKSVKSALAAIAYASGILHWASRRRLAGGAVVLMYHRVLPPELMSQSFSTDSISVTPATFRRQMRLLRRLANPLSVEQLEEALASGRFPRRACVVTFDDGWFDNLDHALPILEEFRIPAVIFLAVDYIGTGRCFWQERLSRLLCAAARTGDGARELFDRFGAPGLPALEPNAAKLAVRRIVDDVKHLSVAERDAVVVRVEQYLTDAGIRVVEPNPDRFLDWEGVRKLAASGVVTLGSHACTHTPLPKLDLPAVEAEFVRSRATIAERAGVTPRTLAYPNGDYTRQIATLAASHYALAFTTERGFVRHGDHPARLRRFNVHEHSTDTDGTFLARMAGFL